MQAFDVARCGPAKQINFNNQLPYGTHPELCIIYSVVRLYASLLTVVVNYFNIANDVIYDAELGLLNYLFRDVYRCSFHY